LADLEYRDFTIFFHQMIPSNTRFVVFFSLPRSGLKKVDNKPEKYSENPISFVDL